VWGLIYSALGSAERNTIGKNPDPSAAIMDSQSVKTTEEGARSNGYDAHNVKGRKRHLLVDTPWVYRSRFTSRLQTLRTG
jgi:putative transposase